jgi:hypothetical protein
VIYIYRCELASFPSCSHLLLLTHYLLLISGRLLLYMALASFSMSLYTATVSCLGSRLLYSSTRNCCLSTATWCPTKLQDGPASTPLPHLLPPHLPLPLPLSMEPSSSLDSAPWTTPSRSQAPLMYGPATGQNAASHSPASTTTLCSGYVLVISTCHTGLHTDENMC